MAWVGVTSLGVIVGFLALAVLGAMRETVLLRGEVEALSELVKNPPPPSYVGARAPDPLVEVLEAGDHRLSAGDKLVVAFLSPGCKPCEALAEGLRTAVEEDQLRREDLVCFAWASTSESARAFAGQLPPGALIDADVALARVCEVRATPTLLDISRVDWQVVDYDVEGDTHWVIDRLMPTGAVVAREVERPRV